MDYLREKKLLDDKRTALHEAERLSRDKAWGRKRISAHLECRLASAEAIEFALAQLPEDEATIKRHSPENPRRLATAGFEPELIEWFCSRA